MLFDQRFQLGIAGKMLNVVHVGGEIGYWVLGIRDLILGYYDIKILGSSRLMKVEN